MWIWEKKITQNDESQWAEKLSGVVGVVFTTLPDSEKSLVQCYCEEAASAAALLTAFGGKMSKLEDRDWVAATAPENSPPLLIRNRLVIVSSPSQVKPMQQHYPKRQVLCFPAERAFGTGNHGTTATCLRMLCDEAHSRRKRDWRIIDVGCGSGILGVAALRLGAKQAICFDFDAAAVEVARRNVERNGCAPGMHVFQADVFEWLPHESERAEIVVANLFSGLLQQAFPRLRSYLPRSSEGILIVSGILREQEHDTLSAAREGGFSLLQRAVCGKWVSMKLTPQA